MNSRIFILPLFQSVISIVLFVCIMVSCSRDMTLEIKTNDRRLIVVGEFTTDSVIHNANLYCSGSLITGQAQTGLKGAVMFITDGIDTFHYIENDTTPGLYQTTGMCRGIGGHSYVLKISNIDLDSDGQKETFNANLKMPVPIQFDSLVSRPGLNADKQQAINNFAYYKIPENGPDYTYNFVQINQNDLRTLSDRIGTGELNAGEKEYRVRKTNVQPYNPPRYYSFNMNKISNSDTITFVGLNFTKNQFDFLLAFDNNANGDTFMDNYLDQLNIPANLPTNIEPMDKASGYFLVYSISRISKIYSR